jgi:hypothetical protein
MSARQERRTPAQKDPANYDRPTGASESPSQARHAGKEAYDLAHGSSANPNPSSGGTPKPEKDAYDVAHGKSGATKPASGGHVRPQKVHPGPGQTA